MYYFNLVSLLACIYVFHDYCVVLCRVCHSLVYVHTTVSREYGINCGSDKSRTTIHVVPLIVRHLLVECLRLGDLNRRYTERRKTFAAFSYSTVSFFFILLVCLYKYQSVVTLVIAPLESQIISIHFLYKGICLL